MITSLGVWGWEGALDDDSFFSQQGTEKDFQ